MRSPLEALRAGRSVVVEAVPGAGKTHLLLEAAAAAPCLLLAYNTQLAAGVRARLGPDSACLTFHGLCSRCLGPARDDDQLLAWVVRAERGEVVAHDVPASDWVLVDEAQDVREAYARLLCVLGLVDRPLLVAGDELQLIYDFDPAFPASLAALRQPARAFGPGAGWERATLCTSYRLTQPCAAFVNALFGTRIEAVRAGPPVEVRAAASPWRLAEALDDLASDGILLLVDRKNGNRGLRELLNSWSRRGVRLRVHGVDDDEAAGAGVLTCGTYWSAKGLEAPTVVVLLPAQCARNPTYVALTRASQRLVVVLDARAPHPLVARTVLQRPEDFDVRGPRTWAVLRAGATADAARALTKWSGGAARRSQKSA